MLTIHHPGGGVRTERNGPVTPGLAVVTDGGRIAEIGSYEKLLAIYGGPNGGSPDGGGPDGGSPDGGGGAGARVRAWDGVLEPGRYAPDGAALLESLYWPDPREADALGTAPLPVADVPMTDTRWGASARRGVQRLLARGVTAAAGPFTRPQVAAAVRRAGLRDRPADFVAGGPADFAVFAIPAGSPALQVSPVADEAGPAGPSLVTVLAGRLVHRRA